MVESSVGWCGSVGARTWVKRALLASYYKQMNMDMAYHFHASLVVEVVRGDDFPNVGPDFDSHVVHPVLFPLRVDPRHLLLPQNRRHATRREPAEN